MTILLVALAALVAWIVSTLGGGGGGLLLVPAVSYLLGARAVAPVTTLTGMVGEPARIVLFRRSIVWTIVRWYLPGAVAGALVGAWLFAHTRAEWLQIVVALFLLSTVWQFRFGRKARSFSMAMWWFLPIGFAVAFFSGLIGATGPVLNPFYLNVGAVKEEMIATKSVNSLAMNFAKVGTYAAFGALSWRLVLYGAAAGVGAALASWLGKRWLRRLSNERFRQLVLAVMVVSGLSLLWGQRAVIAGVWASLTR